MRVLALDIGDVRTGLALSDDRARVATPLKVLATREMCGDGRILQRIFDDYDVGRVVIGLPLSLDGTEGPQARHVRALASKLLRTAGWQLEDEVVFVDERYSSTQAKDALSDLACTARQMRGKVDKLAATLFLQTYLDREQDDARSCTPEGQRNDE